THQQGTTVSDIVRQAVAQTYTAPADAPHTVADCTSVVLRECLPEAQDRVYEAAQGAGVDIATVMRVILHCWLRTQPGGMGGAHAGGGGGRRAADGAGGFPSAMFVCCAAIFRSTAAPRGWRIGAGFFPA